MNSRSSDDKERIAKKIIVGISGASGVEYGVRLLKMLKKAGIETHLVVSRSGKTTLGLELSMNISEVYDLADHYYAPDDIGAAISSGSFKTMGMMIVPCSVKTMSEISTGVTSSLLTRAADVVLKERRKLVMMIRETPLHTGHLRTMTQLSEMGAIIAPPVPAMYAKPENLDQMMDHTLGRLMDIFDLDAPEVTRWQGH